MIAHPGLDFRADVLEAMRAVCVQDHVDVHNRHLRLRIGICIYCHLRPSTGCDVLGDPRAKHLSRIQCRPTRSSRTVCACRLADSVNARDIRAPPRIDRDAAVHVFIFHRKLQRVCGDVDFVARIKFNLERVHMAQPINRQVMVATCVTQVCPDIIVQPIQAELLITGHRQKVAIEVHKDSPSLLPFSKNGQIDKATFKIQHAAGVERSLIALAKNVRRHLLSGAIVVGEEVTFRAIRA